MYFIDIFFLAYFIYINATYTLLILMAFLEINYRRATLMKEFDKTIMSDRTIPPISIISPAHNEEANIISSVQALLQLEYPNFQVIVVNDGSQDQTLEKLQERFQLKPINLVVRQVLKTKEIRAIYQSSQDKRLWVVDKENGGKSDALNAGLNVSRTPLVVCVDADTIIDRNALLRMVEPFIYDERRVIAVGGTVRIANGCEIKEGQIQKVDLPKSWLARFQIPEYIRGFMFGRMGFNQLGGNLIIAGAFGLFYREAVIEAGGYQTGTVGEDMELIVRMHRRFLEKKEAYRVIYIPDPICYTEVPESFKVLNQQRDRWQRGLGDSLWRHRKMFFNPRYGIIGWIVFPVFVFVEFLGPLIELSGYVWFIFRLLFTATDPSFTLMFFTVAFLWGFMLSIESFMLDDMISHIYKKFKVRLGLFLVAFLENFGYRQITLLFRLKGTLRFLIGQKSWGKMTRTGFGKAPDQKGGAV